MLRACHEHRVSDAEPRNPYHSILRAARYRSVTNRAAGVSPRISSAKCVLLWETAAEALAQSDPVWLVQRVVAEEMPAVLDKQRRHQGRLKVVVDMTASV